MSVNIKVLTVVEDNSVTNEEKAFAASQESTHRWAVTLRTLTNSFDPSKYDEDF